MKESKSFSKIAFKDLLINWAKQNKTTVKNAKQVSCSGPTY